MARLPSGLLQIHLRYLKLKCVKCLTHIYMRYCQLLLSKLGFYFSSCITSDVDVIFLPRTSYWSIEDRTYKKVERNTFKTFSRKPARKSEHLCLYTSETHWQFTGIQLIYNGRHAKSKYFNMSHSQMLGKFEYGLPAKFWRLVGCTEMLSW